MYIPFLDCNFAISSIEELLNCRTVLTIDHRNQTNFLTVHTSNDTITTFTDALVIVINDSCQPASSPFCEISNLEVYRGHDQLVGISHEGLSLSDKGAIKVNQH